MPNQTSGRLSCLTSVWPALTFQMTELRSSARCSSEGSLQTIGEEGFELRGSQCQAPVQRIVRGVLAGDPAEAGNSHALGHQQREKSGRRLAANAEKASRAAGSVSILPKLAASSAICCETAASCPIFISRLISSRLLSGFEASLAA